MLPGHISDMYKLVLLCFGQIAVQHRHAKDMVLGLAALCCDCQ